MYGGPHCQDSLKGFANVGHPPLRAVASYLGRVSQSPVAQYRTNPVFGPVEYPVEMSNRLLVEAPFEAPVLVDSDRRRSRLPPVCDTRAPGEAGRDRRTPDSSLAPDERREAHFPPRRAASRGPTSRRVRT